MVSRDDGRHVLYPRYFDSRISRRKGRRVARRWALEEVNVDLIAKVAESLGLHPEIEREARHPSEYEARGRVLVDAVQEKTKTIRIIAKRIHTGNY